jgi:hypothetical protein
MVLLSSGSGSEQVRASREDDRLHELPNLLGNLRFARSAGNGVAWRGVGVDIQLHPELALEQLRLALDRQRDAGVVDGEAAFLKRAPDRRLDPLVRPDLVDALGRDLLPPFSQRRAPAGSEDDLRRHAHG